MSNVQKGPWGKQPVEKRGEPPHDGGMEARIAKLESSMEYVQRDMGEVRLALVKLADEVSQSRAELSAIRERLSHTPTKLDMWKAVAAILLPIGAAVWWIVQQYLGPILARMAG
ncbi:TPA: hypothetical protein ACKQAW_003385 [Stenotrophomonas maltophilia]